MFGRIMLENTYRFSDVEQYKDTYLRAKEGSIKSVDGPVNSKLTKCQLVTLNINGEEMKQKRKKNNKRSRKTKISFIISTS